MSKEYKNLPSEQLPNDGGWHWDRLVREANERLGQIGKHGKRAKIKVTPKPGKPISAQFSLSGKQQNPGLNLPLNKNNLIKAEEICALITGQLVAGTFTHNWLDSLLGKNKKPIEKEKALTCREMLEQYKIHYFKQKKGDKNPEKTWISNYRHITKTFLKYQEKPINLTIIKEAIECTENNTPTREKHLNGLVNLLRHFDNNDFKQIIKCYKAENNPKPKKKYIPNDNEIINIYFSGFEINPYCRKDFHYRYGQWQFLYALLAIYGIRVHEAWNIKNWNTGVYLKNGEWIAIADDTEDINNEDEKGKYTYQQLNKDLYFPAILDPNNQDYLLCIGHETKTGYRVAFPLSPSGCGRNCDWVQKFNLIQPLNLPDILDPFKHRGNHNDCSIKCSSDTSKWFARRKYGFTPHALRHAYNIRGHKLGINQKTLANSLGHGLQMNSHDYLRHEGAISKLESLKQAINKDTHKCTELERLRAENKHLKTEIEKLRTELAMYKAIEQSKHK